MVGGDRSPVLIWHDFFAHSDLVATADSEVHVCKLRRFAAASMELTEQIRTDLARDHPDNIVSKLVDHDLSNGETWFRCRWKGFSKAVDSWQTGEVLHQDCPDVIRKYVARLRARNKCDDVLEQYFQATFPAEEVTKVRLAHVESGTDSEPEERETPDPTAADTAVPSDHADNVEALASTTDTSPGHARAATTNAPAVVTNPISERTHTRSGSTQSARASVTHRYPLRARGRR